MPPKPMEQSNSGTGKTFPLLFKGFLAGFILGLALAIGAASWVWLEMRVNVGLVIPGAMILCPVLACWQRKELSYPVFLAGQFLLFAVLLAIHGLDPDALWAVPAALFREGFYIAGLTLNASGMLMGGILLAGNLLWAIQG